MSYFCWETSNSELRQRFWNVCSFVLSEMAEKAMPFFPTPTGSPTRTAHAPAAAIPIRAAIMLTTNMGLPACSEKLRQPRELLLTVVRNNTSKSLHFGIRYGIS